MSQNATEPVTVSEVNQEQNVEETPAEAMEVEEDHVHVAQYIEIDNTQNTGGQDNQERRETTEQQQELPQVEPSLRLNEPVEVLQQSPNEFRDEVKSKASKRSSKPLKSPFKPKSPEKDDEVGFAAVFILIFL